MTQGEALSVIAYGIEVLPLLRELWGTHHCITQPWYADDAGAEGSFVNVLSHLQDLQERGTPRGYFE